MKAKIKARADRARKRRLRVRGKVIGTAEIPRLTVAKSLRNTFVQIVDDTSQATLIGLATNSRAMADNIGEKDTKTEKAKKLGLAIAEKALEKGVKKVVFDRNQYRYHGRIKAVAEGAREKGLEF